MRVHVAAYATDGSGRRGRPRKDSFSDCRRATSPGSRWSPRRKARRRSTIFRASSPLSAAARTIERFGGADLLDASTLIFSTGSEGVLSPVVYVMAAIGDDGSGGSARAPGHRRSADPGDDGGRAGDADPCPADRERGRRGDGGSRAGARPGLAGLRQEPDPQPSRCRGDRRSRGHRPGRIERAIARRGRARRCAGARRVVRDGDRSTPVSASTCNAIRTGR